MKVVWTLMLLVFTPAAIANSITICKQDQLLVSSNTIEVVSQSHQNFKLKHNCDLEITPLSNVVVANRGKTIVKDRSITILVDNQKNYCRVQSIDLVT